MNMFRHIIGVKVEKGPTILLSSGATFDFLDPWASDFTIDDIAHGLSQTCRYAGQCRSFYSVAEHSILVSRLVPQEYALEGLLHDATEAFIGDITRPLKQMLPDFKAIEARVEEAIATRFGFKPDYKAAIKPVDLQVLAAEQMQIMPAGCADWAEKDNVVPADIAVESLDPVSAKAEFLARLAEISA
jgi:5'-deoxynucleotidase YfbR-like HD superfamily hydrolase